MTKKVLMLAAKANMIQQFNHRNIKILQELGYEVHVATNMVDFGSMSSEENERFKRWMIENDVVAHQVDFERRMGTFKGNIRSIQQLRRIFKENPFSFIHVHSPLGSILGRFVANQYNVPTIYTAHGFHFFKGGPKSGWLVFYPLEWLFSFFTDTLITINDEDYALAKNICMQKIVKTNGIGVDVEKAWIISDEYKKEARQHIRSELNIPNDAFLISSVGELSDRKNHRIVLEALKKLTPNDREKVYYIIAGTGSNKEKLKNLANSFNFSKHLKLLGYRTDIHEINFASDISVFPSFQEGLGVAGLEAVIDGSYLIGSNVRGIRDYIFNPSIGQVFSAEDSSTLANLIKNRIQSGDSKERDNKELIKFDFRRIDSEMKKIYESKQE